MMMPIRLLAGGLTHLTMRENQNQANRKPVPNRTRKQNWLLKKNVNTLTFGAPKITLSLQLFTNILGYTVMLILKVYSVCNFRLHFYCSCKNEKLLNWNFLYENFVLYSFKNDTVEKIEFIKNSVHSKKFAFEKTPS